MPEPAKVAHHRLYDVDGWSYQDALDLRYDGRTAMVVVDMQYHDTVRDQGYCLAVEQVDPGSMEYFCTRVQEVVVPTIRQLLDDFRANGSPIVYVLLGSEYRDYRDLPPRGRRSLLNLEARSGISGIFWSGSPSYAVVAELAPQDGDTIIRKITAGAFSSSNIDQVLRSMGIENLLFTGVTTNCCVESTARAAAELGYGCVLIDDAMAEFDPEAHEATLRAFHFNFGHVLKDANAVRAAMQSGTPLTQHEPVGATEA